MTMKKKGDGYKTVIADIDLPALRHNYAVIKKQVPNSKVMAVVKSNAYGHGIVPVTTALADLADFFGVAWLGEAIKVKEAGINTPILLLKGFLNAEELLLANELNLEIVIHNFHQIELLEKTPLKHKVKVWLKIDTGMNRLGFHTKDAEHAYQRLMTNAKVVKPLNIMTHLSDADDTTSLKSAAQIELFNKITTNFAGPKCIANSGGTFNWPKAHANIVRTGITLYGVSPYVDKTGLDLGLKPVMTLRSKLLALKNLNKGDQVGYGSTWVCPEHNVPIGIANIGYGDGYPRHIADQAPILVNGIRCSTVGRISMDMLAIDLRPCPNAKIEDPIILWGKGLPIEEIAKSAETVPHEIFCRLTQRVYFNY
jgi:alanine racemase